MSEKKVYDYQDSSDDDSSFVPLTRQRGVLLPSEKITGSIKEEDFITNGFFPTYYNSNLYANPRENIYHAKGMNEVDPNIIQNPNLSLNEADKLPKRANGAVFPNLESKDKINISFIEEKTENEKMQPLAQSLSAAAGIIPRTGAEDDSGNNIDLENEMETNRIENIYLKQENEKLHAQNVHFKRVIGDLDREIERTKRYIRVKEREWDEFQEKILLQKAESVSPIKEKEEEVMEIGGGGAGSESGSTGKMIIEDEKAIHQSNSIPLPEIPSINKSEKEKKNTKKSKSEKSDKTGENTEDLDLEETLFDAMVIKKKKPFFCFSFITSKFRKNSSSKVKSQGKNAEDDKDNESEKSKVKSASTGKDSKNIPGENENEGILIQPQY